MSSPSAFETLFGGMSDLGLEHTLAGGKKSHKKHKKHHKPCPDGLHRLSNGRCSRVSSSERRSGYIAERRKGRSGRLRRMSSVRHNSRLMEGRKCPKGERKDMRKYRMVNGERVPQTPGVNCRRNSMSQRRKYSYKSKKSRSKSLKKLAKTRALAHARLADIREEYDLGHGSNKRATERALQEERRLLGEVEKPKRRRKNEAELLAAGDEATVEPIL